MKMSAGYSWIPVFALMTEKERKRHVHGCDSRGNGNLPSLINCGSVCCGFPIPTDTVDMERIGADSEAWEMLPYRDQGRTAPTTSKPVGGFSTGSAVGTPPITTELPSITMNCVVQNVGSHAGFYFLSRYALVKILFGISTSSSTSSRIISV